MSEVAEHSASENSNERPEVVRELAARFGSDCVYQETVDAIPNLWVPKTRLVEVMRHLKEEVARPFPLLFDVSAIDERLREHRAGQPDSDFTAFYHLISLERNADVRIKVALQDDDLNIPTLTGVWPVANWYEREAFDMFGINFEGHPNLRRILTPPQWEGHPLRKEHPARATEMDPYSLSDEFLDAQQEELRFVPEEWGMS